jgi:predicted small metal-binding protein
MKGGRIMKQFWCGAVIPDCQAKFQGESDDEVLRQVAAHATRDHGIDQLPREVVERVRSLIRSVG